MRHSVMATQRKVASALVFGITICVFSVPMAFAAESVAVGHLGDLMKIAENTAPAIVKAKREVETATKNLADAQASLGWVATISTPKAASISGDTTGDLAADLRLNTTVARSIAPGQSIGITAEQMTVSRQKDASSYKAGPLTLGWSFRYPFQAGDEATRLLLERERLLKQKEAALSLAIESARVSVAGAYFSYWKSQLDLQVARKQLESYTLQYERTQSLAGVGRATGQDLAIAAQRVTVAQLEIKTRDAEVNKSLRDLARQMGVMQDSLLVPQLVQPSWFPADVGALETWLTKASDRPEVRQAHLGVQAALDQVEDARLVSAYDLEPLVSYDVDNSNLSFGVNINRVKEAGDGSFNAALRATPGGKWSINTSFTTSLGGPSVTSQYDISLSNAEVDLRSAELTLKQTQEDAEEKFRTLWSDVQLKAAQRDMQKALLDREKLNLQTVLTRADLGAATPGDIADAQVAYAQAEVAAQKALFDQQLAYIKLLAAVGGKDALTRLEG